MSDWEPIEVYNASAEIVKRLNVDTDSKVFYRHDSSNMISFKGSFDGIFASPYAGRVKLTVEEALPHAKDLLQWLTSQEDIPQLPQEEEETLKAFLAALIGDDDLSDQLLKPLRNLHPDPDKVVPRLRALTEQARGVHDRSAAYVPRLALDQLGTAVQGIPLAPFSPAQEILGRIEAELRGRVDAGCTEAEKAGEMIDLVGSLSPVAREWLEQLALHLVRNPGLKARLQIRLRGYLWNYVQHDHHHYFLYGQTAERLAPRSWIEAGWNYIEHFRCNFGFFVTEAMLYPTITVVGAPDVRVPVTEDEEKFLREYLPQSEAFRFERLWVRTADELKALLDKRVANGIRFVGGDVGPHVPA